jgi:hypothetical protein
LEIYNDLLTGILISQCGTLFDKINNLIKPLSIINNQ